MNLYLIKLLNTIGIDTEHLKSKYLSTKEVAYLDNLLVSKQDFEQDFYTNRHGDRLECLLLFLHNHKKDINDLMHGRGKVETLIELYTSSTISGDYDCFRFDLSKFQQTYTPKNQVLTLYRIGRGDECAGNLGCSWATSIDGLKAYCYSSGISEDILKSKPIFVMIINDLHVLFEGNKKEHELVLKPNFSYKSLAMLDDKLRSQIC